MNSKLKVFCKVVYYLFTIIIGVMMAIMLPASFLEIMVVEDTTSALQQGNFARAMAPVGGYYNDQIVYQTTFGEGSGLVLFEAVTVQTDADTNQSLLQKSYVGYLYGVGNQYNVTKTIGNGAKILVTNNGTETSLSILDADTNEDGYNDSCSAVTSYGFLLLELTQQDYQSISQLKFVDADNNVYQQVTFDTALDYSTQFFDDVDEIVTSLNSLIINKASQSDFNATRDRLFQEFANKSNHYKQSDVSEINVKADKKAATIVVIYFVAIYLIGDSLLGKRYFIRFIKWILQTVFKVKFKQKTTTATTDEAFGNDYYCQVTIKLDTTAVPDMNQSVTVQYTNSNCQISFTLLRGEGYQATQRVKAGTYVNPWVQMDSKYTISNLPENLVVSGYKMTIELKINA